MTRAKPTDPRQRRGLGLDKPCSVCGREIYYGYQGPFEGTCGRCTDRIVAKHPRVLPTKTVVVQRASERTVRMLLTALVFVLGLVAGVFLRSYLPF